MAKPEGRMKRAPLGQLNEHSQCWYVGKGFYNGYRRRATVSLPTTCSTKAKNRLQTKDRATTLENHLI